MLVFTDEKNVESASPATESIAVAGKPDAEQLIIHDFHGETFVTKISPQESAVRPDLLAREDSYEISIRPLVQPYSVVRQAIRIS